MPVYYVKGQEVEVLYNDRWNCGAVISEATVRRRLKRRIDYLYRIQAAVWHELRNVPPSQIRLPSLYPTRKAAWTIQEFHDGKWENSKHSFDSARRWTHDLATVLHILRMDKSWTRLGREFRAYNHQTGEQILGAALTHE